MDRPEAPPLPSADRLLARYRIRCDAARIEARAAALALEQSVEMPAEAIADGAIRATVPGRVGDDSQPPIPQSILVVPS